MTVIENLDQFGIDPKEFGHTVQVRVACSSSVTPSQQKNKGPQVVVQGNQINCVGDLLLSEYIEHFSWYLKVKKKGVWVLGLVMDKYV